jgi:hypothetical protein
MKLKLRMNTAADGDAERAAGHVTVHLRFGSAAPEQQLDAKTFLAVDRDRRVGEIIL